MRANLLVVLLVLLFGVGVSLLLVPRSGELALQKFRDQDYASARTEYERRMENGDRSAATVMPLTRLYLAEGEVERAIALLEDHVDRHPADVDGRELLARLYQDAQRQGDYLETLRELARLKPGDEIYRDLAVLAGFQNRPDIQVEALTRYAGLRPDDVEMQQLLAGLLAVRGDGLTALDWLLKADDRAEGHIASDSRELLLSLLIDLNREEEAFPRLQRWLGENPRVDEVIGLASQLAAAGRPDLALRLVEPALATPDAPLGLRLTGIDLLLAAGRTEEAQQRLLALSGPVEDAVLGRLVSLMLNAGLERPAFAAVQGRDLRLVPDWALAGLAEMAFRAWDRALLDRMAAELGDGFLADRPVLAANIALGRNDKAAATRWAERAVADPDQPMPDRLAGLRLLDRLGRRAEAISAFDRLALAGTVPDDLLEELAGLFADLGRAPRGLSWFVERRKASPSAAAEQGWARLAARTGDPAEVLAWLDRQPGLDEGVLQDIAAAAAERGAAALALTAAGRVFAQSPTPRNRFALATALLSAKRPDEALPHLTALLPAGGVEVETAYLAALDALGRTEEMTRYLGDKLARGGLTGEEEQAIAFALLDRKAYRAALPVLRARAERLGGEWLFAYADAARKAGAVEELASLLEAQLADPALDPAGREQRAFLLLEAGGPARALPVLKRLATGSLSGPWDGLYRDALTKLGRKAELRQYLVARAGDARLPAAERRSLAFLLLEQDDKPAAVRVLQSLAAGKGAESDEFRQLAYLWGPRPPASALDWIEAQAKAAGTPDGQAAWYAKLAELGGARRVTETLAQAAGAPAPLKAPLIEALAAEGKGRELADAVRAAAATERDPDRLRRYARLAAQSRQRGAAVEAWKALLAARPEDAEALRQLGMLAYDENRLEEAERFLRRFLAKGAGDYEANYFLGEALTARKRGAEAAPFYRRALEQIAALPARGDAVLQTEANVLNRLGRVDDAVALFERLRRQRPADRQLKADYASMLIENGRLQEARRVLSVP
ncbi:tetratricopeptide repeat protein [Azospirillum thermophilum]|uniref:Tetratricopeptide repeat protein n=1 Tax=Azospirillum thermophilum TaxID=2202148 RepID=A0A2S2CXG8_9PROT|nr:tetratricopeptide repeat protein [Azospirillum thermophilum]AWK89181.1 hypothetical protein DEW08_24700 [Azospirillum thermophilum]